ncbi:caspase domain-containing protein, partial [Cubamyces menziesii]
IMWDFSGSASSSQGSPAYHAQQHSRALTPAPSCVPCFPRGYQAGPPPMPFMPIGAPGSDNIMVDRYHSSSGPWVAPGAAPAPPVHSQVSVHIHSHHTSHHPHSHSNSHSHSSSRSRSHSHSHTPRPTVQQHSSAPTRAIKYRPQIDPIQPVQPHEHPRFFLSKCTGKKKAVCIGINYRGQANELHGCVNDARNVQGFLMRHGYKAKNIRVLTDDARDPDLLPTHKNIIRAMHWLVTGACAHDSLFFHYSGHGGQVKDKDGDEVDGYDEVIFPLDYKASGCIVDDLMHTIMVKRLPAGCRLTALFDSCHSGSVLDLPYLYSTDGRVKGSQVSAKWFEYKSTPADVISWSGCKDSQTSADTWEKGVATGAMSYAFMSSLHKNPNQTYQELLRSIRVILQNKYSQKPQLSSSHRIDTNLRFII